MSTPRVHHMPDLPRPASFAEWERRCQKPDHRRVGSFLARRVARPAALRVTRVIAPWGISAHAATLVAWATGLAAVAAFGWATPGGWLLGCALLHLWYLLDHVDGQLARYHRAETLDGAQLDYLMHHTLNLLLPVGLGWGIAVATRQPAWTLVGVAAGMGLLLLGLIHDTRYKAFVKRWKRLRGELRLLGGGGGRPAPPAAARGNLLRRGVWLARKFCEMPGLLACLPAVAAISWCLGDSGLMLGRCYLVGLSIASLGLSVASLVRAVRGEAAEREFAAWFAPPPDCCLTQVDGWWEVHRIEP